MRCRISVEEKGNIHWANDATRGTLYTKCAFLPWNIIMKGREFTLVSPLEIGNKDYITTYILSPICDLEHKPLHLNIFGNLKIKS